MPSAMHPQAKFDPIPPDLDLHDLVDRAANFDWVLRIPLVKIRRLGPTGFEKLVQLHVIEGGRPLVIEGWDKVLPSNLFSVQWLESTYDKKQENVRDINAQTDIPMTTGHYLRAMAKLTNQWTTTNFRDERRQRLYLKDIDCPREWHDHLKKVIPPNVFYMNDNISDIPTTHHGDDSDIFGAPEKPIAVAGDLMSSLPEEMRAQNLMCYIGHEGTYTPAHREMCASLGQNIMVEASGDQNGEKPGSSIWFMTETKDREVVREYFLSMLGHDIEIEKHFAQINAWKKANFPVHIVKQKAGDFILIPPLAPHQVWNRGTRTMKVAWNRTTVDTLRLALQEALPKARLVCRDEQYKNKAIIYFTLEKYYNELQMFEDSSETDWLGLGQELMQNNSRSKRMLDDFKRLFRLFTDILVSEMFSQKQMNVEHIPFDSNITCSYCRSNIFNRFLTCKHCVRPLINGDEDTYDICMECYAMGRSCICISGLQWCEQWTWSELVDKHELWRAMIIKQDGFVDLAISPPPLEVARRLSRKKTVAQICQEQLKKRPWNDISKPPEENMPESEPEPEVDDEGRVKKKRKRKPKKGDVYKCHTCAHKDNTWKLQYCTTCPEAYCYGVLWRAFDIMPQTAMEAEYWRCPKCLGYCNCGACRRYGHTEPYIPRNTLLGHDTRPIADDRSVEAVVDFRSHNLNWLKVTGEPNRSKDTKRMQRLKEKADAEKSKDLLHAASVVNDAHMQDAPAHEDVTFEDGVDHGSSQDHQHLHPGGPNGQDASGSMVPMADMSAQWEEQPGGDPDMSNYPDPTIMTSGRMMGMGFYDQDESENRILFDAFDASQMAMADSANNESQMSEHVKKALRQAKRKSRLGQEDDPDFRAPKKNYHKKKSEFGNLGQLANLDPALMDVFGDANTSNASPQAGSTPTESATPAPSTAPVAPTVAAAPAAPTEQDNQDSNTTLPPDSVQAEQNPPRQALPIDPLRPTLRHAKPRASYVDQEEPQDDPDELIPNRPYTRLPRKQAASAEDIPADAIDRAADVALGLAPPPPLEDDGIVDGDAPPATRKRGRQPTYRHGAPAETDAVPSEPPKHVANRPSPESLKRMRLERAQAADEDTSMLDVDDGSDAEAEWREATGTRARGGDSSDPDFKQARHSGPAAPTGKRREPARDVDSEDELRVVTPPPPKRRGRPPGRKSEPLPRPPLPEPPASVQETDMQFLSMAERMALKGKKFKIRGRKPMPAASTQGPKSDAGTPKADTPKPPPAARAREEEPEEDKKRCPAAPVSSPAKKTVTVINKSAELDPQPLLSEDEGNSSSSASSIAAEPTSRKRSGPTVVRLESSGSEHDDNDDDDDISSTASGAPSGRKPTYVATRGRGRGRGRPRGSGSMGGRGRGRGRPRLS